MTPSFSENGHDENNGRGQIPPPGSTVFNHFKRLIERVDIATYWAVVAVMALMTVFISLQVFWRYVLGSSIDSANELSRLFFVWAIFLAIPHGVKHGVHVGIDLFVMMMPERLRELLFRISAGLSALLMLMVMVGSLIATIDGWNQLMPTLPITSSVYFIAVMVCGAHAFLHLTLLTWGGSSTWEVNKP